MKKYKYEIVLFIINAIYMILELIASRVLSPYFGSSNLVWTSVIGIILLSTSVGNFVGGIIADKNKEEKKSIFNVSLILILIGAFIFMIPLVKSFFIEMVVSIVKSLRLGAIISTILLFFVPSMFIGMLSPIIIRLKMHDLGDVGKISGGIYAIATLGSIFGTFLGGFYLIPKFGSIQILFVLSIITFLLIFILYNKENKMNWKMICGLILVIAINGVLFYLYYNVNEINGQKVLNGEFGCHVNYDTEYGNVIVKNAKFNGENIRGFIIDRGNESASFIDESKCYDLVFDYTKFYDLMFNSKIEIKDTLMIGGAGYSYPKYFISKFKDKNMDVVEIDPKVTEIAKKYFFLDKLISDYNLEQNKRLNLFNDDGRTFLNNNIKKYDAILNDSFSGNVPAKTLTTKEAVQMIHNYLNDGGVYLTNVISSIDGNNSKFLKAEVLTLKNVFKNVYVFPCNDVNDIDKIQNNMVVACDEQLFTENYVDVNLNDAILLTDNYCPVDTIIPNLDAHI